MKAARTALLLSSLILSTSFVVQAEQAPGQNATAQDQPATAADAMVVAIDPRTGKLRQPTAAEVKALQTKAAAMPSRPALSQARGARPQPRTAAEARATLRSHGARGKSMQVPESAMSQLTVTQGADGQLHFSEGDTAQQARQEVSK